jgi:uncharacterized protein (TIGR02231 family)
MQLAINAPIVAVTVYTDRARITRRGSHQLTPGVHHLVIGGLPTTIEEDSVRASGHGTGLKILGAEISTQFITIPPEAEIAELEAQIDGLREQDSALADSEATTLQQIEYITKLRTTSSSELAKGIAYGRATIETSEALNSYLAREQETAQARKRELAKQRRELARQIEALQARLDQIQHGNHQERRSIVVSVEATQETSIDLEVIYVARGASWEPNYDIRLEQGDVVLTYLAQVRQHTGEDWPEVQLALSTARPAVNATIPELHPWYIDIVRPIPAAPPPMARSMPAPAPMMAADMTTTGGGPGALMMAKAEIAQAQVERRGAAVSYRIVRPTSVPSDGTPHRTTVTTLNLSAQLDHITAPKIAAEAYLRATITNTSSFVLLPGKANIFHGDEFVGRTYLDNIAPNEEFEAQLGIDDRVKVEHKLINRSVDKSFIGSTRRTQMNYSITITNLLETNARVRVMDQIPVSRHESLKVKLLDATPKPTEQSDLNVLTWELTLKPQEKREIQFGFVVEQPRDQTVTGLS